MSKTETIHVAPINRRIVMVVGSKAIWFVILVSSKSPTHFAIPHTMHGKDEGSTTQSISLTEGF